MPIPEPLAVLTTIRDFIRWGSSEFLRAKLDFGHGFASAFDEARYLTLHVLALPWDWSDAYFDTVLTESEREQVIDIVQLRVNSRQPVAYITRESWFCGLKFYVDERVLVPRSPIAELISSRFEPWVSGDRVTRVLDLCCGSGCIAIATGYNFPEAEIYASDVSRDALEVARVNLEKHSLSDQVTLVESDLFENIPVQSFDVIICNPPYVDAEDMAALSDEFKFEPVIGLQAGVDGLDLVAQILVQAAEYLSEDGVIFIEVGNSQAAMENNYNYLPMIWVEFEFGGGGVCCIQASDLKRQQTTNAAQRVSQ